MKKTLLILALILSFGQMLAQKSSIWSAVSHDQTAKLAKVRTDLNEERELYFSLDAVGFKQTLVNAKDKFSQLPGVVVEFPNISGEIEKFKVWENSNMDPNFQALYPQIRAYVGKSTTDGSTINFSVSPQGIQTLLFRTNGVTEYIEAYDKAATAYRVFDSSVKLHEFLNTGCENWIFDCNTERELDKYLAGEK